MNAASRISFLLLRALAVGSVACGRVDDADGARDAQDAPATTEDHLNGSMAIGTYVIKSAPSGETYVKRITFSSGNQYEADVVTGDGDAMLLAGGYSILEATPNDPDSPIQTDKPTLALMSNAGAGPLYFEYDELASGSLKFYGGARSYSFTLKKDPSWHPAATNAKVITCTGPFVSGTITLDQSQNRRGTLAFTRNAGIGDDDAPDSASVAVSTDPFSGDPSYVYFAGSRGDVDYYVNLTKNDFGKSSGSVHVNARWAEYGEEHDLGLSSCTVGH